MAERFIDYDRGVIIHKDQDTGMEIFMYRDDPGVYLDAFGRRVSDERAAASGFRITKYAKLREHRQALRKVTDALSDLDKLDLGLAARAVLEQRDGYSLIGLQNGRAVIEGPDGKAMSRPGSREEMKLAFDAIFDEIVDVDPEDRRPAEIPAVRPPRQKVAP